MFARMRQWRRLEQGAALGAVFILSLPLVLAAFGFGFDALRLSYAKRYAQGRLDLATQAAASVTYTEPDGAIRLGTPSQGEQAAIDEAYLMYAANIGSKRAGADGDRSFFSCPTSSIQGQYDLSVPCAGYAEIVGSPPPVDFNFCSSPGTAAMDPAMRDAYGIRYTVKETVPFSFLSLIGVPSSDFTIVSETLLRQRNC